MYIYRKGQISGTVILAYWKPQCHDVRLSKMLALSLLLTSIASPILQTDPLAPSKNQVETATRFAISREVIHALDPIGARVNAILEFLAPEAFLASVELRSRIRIKYPWAQDLFTNDCLLMHGRSFAFNRQTNTHTDSRGPLGEWTPLVGLGFSVGVKLRLAGIKEILCFEPGTIIFLRGGEIPHSIEAWTGGQRVSIACFTHKNIWDEFCITYPWSHHHKNMIHIIVPV